MDQIVAELSNLTEQLNKYRPASEANVGAAQKQVTDEVEKRLTLQSSRIDTVSESVQKTQKGAEDNSQMLQNLLIGIENMGDSIKQFKADMEEWRNPDFRAKAEREYQETAAELMQEVPLSFPGISEPQSATFTLPVSSFHFSSSPGPSNMAPP